MKTLIAFERYVVRVLLGLLLMLTARIAELFIGRFATVLSLLILWAGICITGTAAWRNIVFAELRARDAAGDEALLA